jgi:polyhydroxyalkanoate synthase
MPFASGAEALFPELAQRIGATLERLRQARDVAVGCSAKRAVWSCRKTTLYQYLPLGQAQGAAPSTAPTRPLLICFALVNRPYVLDLQPDRSLVRRLLEAGFTVYLIDWGDPDEADRAMGLEEYVETHLGGSVRHILETHALEALDLLGVCQGGVLSLMYTALHGAQVANLITVTTPVDFHTPENLLSKWVRGLDTELLTRTGNVPGEVLNTLFLSLMPFRLTQHKYVRLLTGAADQRAVEDFVRMERWIFDSPPQAGLALAQFVRWFYQENGLIRGTVRIAGRAVRLRDIRQPVLNLYALGDHIVPPSACSVMQRYLGTRDYSACAIDTGHIGMYVSRHAAKEIPERIISWLREHDLRRERAKPERRRERAAGKGRQGTSRQGVRRPAKHRAGPRRAPLQ